MKQLTCEMCGSTDLVKQDGFFVCQTCGIKYSVEEAKKMMIEGTVEVQGTVKVDDSDKIENYIQLVKTASNNDNWKQVEEYVNKILEINSGHLYALVMQNIAIFYNSITANFSRLDDFFLMTNKTWSDDGGKLVRKILIHYSSSFRNICEKINELQDITDEELLHYFELHFSTYSDMFEKFCMVANKRGSVDGCDVFIHSLTYLLDDCFSLGVLSLKQKEKNESTEIVEAAQSIQFYAYQDAIRCLSGIRRWDSHSWDDNFVECFWTLWGGAMLSFYPESKNFLEMAAASLLRRHAMVWKWESDWETFVDDEAKADAYLGALGEREKVTIHDLVDTMRRECRRLSKDIYSKVIDFCNKVLLKIDPKFSEYFEKEKQNKRRIYLSIIDKIPKAEKEEDLKAIIADLKKIGPYEQTEKYIAQCKEKLRIYVTESFRSTIVKLDKHNIILLNSGRSIPYSMITRIALTGSDFRMYIGESLTKHYYYYWKYDSDEKEKAQKIYAELLKRVQGVNPNVKEGAPFGACYVATCVYGSYDCPQVWTLRRYRDDTLASTWYGRAFIRTYYAISPTLVKWFGKTKWFKKMWKGKLDRMVKKLQDDGVESTPYEDKEW